MSETYELAAELREKSGKGAARAVRRNNMVPAVVYGDKKPPVPIALPDKELTMKLHGGGFLTTIATLKVDGEAVRVIPKDYQLDPVRDTIMHVDFLRVSKDSVLTLEIAVNFVSEEASPGLERGGVLNVVRHTVELNVPADSIPDSLTADLTGLDIGDGVHISDIALPEGVTPTITDRDFTIATIAAPAALTAEEDAGTTEDDEETEVTEQDAETVMGEDEEEAEGEEGSSED